MDQLGYSKYDDQSDAKPPKPRTVSVKDPAEGGSCVEEESLHGVTNPKANLDFLKQSKKERKKELMDDTNESEDIELLMWTYGLGVKSVQDDESYRILAGLKDPSNANWHGLPYCPWSKKLWRSPLCYWIAESLKFQVITGILITVNIVTIGIIANHEVVTVLTGGQRSSLLNALESMEVFFSVSFIVEVLIRFLGCPFAKPWQDGWLILDSMVTFINALDLWLFQPLGSSTLSAISSFRCLRAFRAVRIVRLVRLVPALRILAETLGEAFRQTLWIIVVVLLFTFAVAIVFTGTMGLLPLPEGGYNPTPLQSDQEGEGMEVIEDPFFYVTPYNAFESVASSMLTLNSILLRGLRWGPTLLRPLLYSDDFAYVFSGLLLLVFITFSLVCLANLISGMFVSSLMETARKDAAIIDHESLTAGQNSVNHLKKMYEKMDQNDDKMLTWTEFREGLNSNKELATQVDMEDARALFRTLDDNNSGLVNYDEFLLGWIKLTRTTKTIDMVSIDYQQQKTFKALKKIGEDYENDFHLMRTHMCEIDSKLDKLCTEATALTVGLQETEHEEDMIASKPLSDIEERKISRGSSFGGSSTRSRLQREIAESEDLEIFECEIFNGHPNKRHLMRILAEMEATWEFKTRLKKLKAALDRLGDEAEERSVAIQDGRQASLLPPSSAEKAKQPHDSQQVWCEMLFDEVMPWLRRTLAAMQVPDRVGAEVPLDGRFGALGTFAAKGVRGAAWALPVGEQEAPFKGNVRGMPPQPEC